MSLNAATNMSTDTTYNASNSSSSVSLPSAIRFSGRDQDFPIWKIKFTLYLASVGLQHALHDNGVKSEPVGVLSASGKGGRVGTSTGAPGGKNEDEEAKEDAEVHAQGASSMSLGHPGASVSSADGALKIRESMKVHSLLLQALQEPSLTEMVLHVEAGNCRAVWELLVKRFERKSTANKAHVYERLLKMKMKDDERIDNYVARIKNVKMVLNDMNEKIPDSLVTHVLLTGLPKSYTTLKQAISLQSSLTLDELIVHLIDHQEKEKFQDDDDVREIEDVANFAGGVKHGGRSFGGSRPPYKSVRFNDASSSGANGRGGVGGGPRACWSCGNTGHLARTCPSKKCYSCGKIGHMSAQCPSSSNASGGHGGMSTMRYGGAAMSAVSNTQARSRNEAKYNEADEDEVAWMSIYGERDEMKSMSKHQSRTVMYYLDSGATRHLVNNLALLHDVRPLRAPTELHVADGATVTLTSEGTGLLRGLNGRSVPLHDVAYSSQLAANLISVSCIVKSGCTILFDESEAIVRNQRGQVVMRFPKRGKLFVLEQEESKHAHSKRVKAEAGGVRSSSTSSPSPTQF